MTSEYKTEQPDRSEIDALTGPAVVEFGTNWCGICKAAQPNIAEAFTKYPDIRRIKVEDGSGRPLGRSFNVRLWPTLVFMRDGKQVAKLVRPEDSQSIADALALIAQPS
ncbi:thioredoxin 1 [Variovorax sp. YR266]|uniref:thioredoxin family protein n=1 Tax=Variovorax sp. YR266 TaxID=1884386 RepID=UPI000894EDDF|nr:thioredoxin family protein [Variovorax sp. YR266]SDZ58772.1 thioredoxin 1 [Variovorax sp. YR266]